MEVLMRRSYLSGVFLALSGFMISLNSTFEHGIAHMQGKRSTMEDAHISVDPLCDEGTSLFALFDGHGGSDIADYAAQNIQQAVERSTTFPDDLTNTLHNAFDYLDQQLAQEPLKYIAFGSGSTAVVALIQNNQLYNAHVGDSRAVLSQNGRAVPLTNDHKPDRPDEKDRIEDAGGFVGGDPARVCGSLAVSRAFGDLALRDAGVIATPETTHVTLTPQDEFLLLACDGVFEEDMTNQQAIDFVRESLAHYTGDPQAVQKAAQELIEEAYNRGSRDNISALVILLNQNQNNIPANQTHVVEQNRAQDSALVQPGSSNQAPAALDNFGLHNQHNQQEPIPLEIPSAEPAVEPELNFARRIVHEIKKHKALAIGAGIATVAAGTYLLRKPIYNLYNKAVLNAKDAWQKLRNKKITKSTVTKAKLGLAGTTATAYAAHRAYHKPRPVNSLY